MTTSQPRPFICPARVAAQGPGCLGGPGKAFAMCPPPLIISFSLHTSPQVMDARTKAANDPPNTRRPLARVAPRRCRSGAASHEPQGPILDAPSQGSSLSNHQPRFSLLAPHWGALSAVAAESEPQGGWPWRRPAGRPVLRLCGTCLPLPVDTKQAPPPAMTDVDSPRLQRRLPRLSITYTHPGASLLWPAVLFFTLYL